MESFYISCPVGFEERLREEIQECWPWLIELNGQTNQSPWPEMLLERGGVLIKCSFEFGLQLNFFIKTAHRVLWRVAEFKVRDFPKLYEKIQKIPWSQFLSAPEVDSKADLKADLKVEWVVAASKSRLNHEKRIEETCREAFAKASSKWKKETAKPSSQTLLQSIYVRLHEDTCTVSLDASGENLHKRGWGTFKGEAPLRETLAAFMVRTFLEDTSPSLLQKVTLVDPMCGSGTLLLEAASLWQPHFKRDFSFLHWKNTPKIFKTPLFTKNYKFLTAKTPFKSYRGFDLQERVLSAANENLKHFKQQTEIEDLDIVFERENLFSAEVPTSGKDPIVGPVWCLTNPPYGERLHVQGQASFSYQDLLQRMADKFHSEKLGLLLPDKPMVRSLRPPKGFHKSGEHSFSNGGLDVMFLIFQKLK